MNPDLSPPAKSATGPGLDGTADIVLRMESVVVGDLSRPNYGRIEDVNWTVGAGQFWVIGGAPGAGKSQLLATAAGIQKPISGTVELFGKATHRCGESELTDVRRRLALVFENGGRLFHDLTLAENIRLPLDYHGMGDLQERAARLAELATALDLQGCLGARPGELSAAWRQRAALGRALASYPHLLLLDNPFAHLDATHLRWWQELLEHLSQGHPLLRGRPITIVVACTDFRRMNPPGACFAMLQGRGWHLLGSRPDPGRHDVLALEELPEVEVDNSRQTRYT